MLKAAGSEKRNTKRRRVFGGTGSGIDTYPSKQLGQRLRTFFAGATKRVGFL
jgi:hypothetical protein